MHPSSTVLRGWLRPRATAAALFFGLAGLAAVPDPASTQSQPPAGFDRVRISKVYPTDIRTGGLVTVALDTATIVGGFDPAKLVLYLDHVPLAGSEPVVGGVKRSVLTYRLDRTAENRDAWLTLFRRHSFRTKGVSIGVGLVPFGEVQGASTPVNLSVVYGRSLVAGAVVAILLAVCMIAWGGALLREWPGETSLRDSHPEPDPVRPFSLGRVQMAFWFTLVAGSYIVIALATRDHNGILNETTLILMGIGAGTALGSAAIQTQKRESAVNRLRALRPELAMAKAQMEAEHATADEARSRLRADPLVVEAVDLEKRTGKSGSRGFWKDLISDDTGPSFHRFQIMAWTILFGIVFVRHVVWYVTMPTFDTTLLALLGISGGTYLGFKIPERQP